MSSRLRAAHCLAVLIALAAPGPEARAQIGLGTDLLTGTVRSADGRLLAGAQVEAFSLETQVTRRATSDRNGRFTILFPDGGGQYRMTARAIGFTPVQELLNRHGDEDRLIWDVRLTPGAVALDAITVEGRPAPAPVRLPNAPTPGSSERTLNPELVSRLPIDPEDLSLLATLVPGVVGLD
ncbi:MAG TPA: carboxypeptidase-like regulatory domain-containing protein, partial [Gemmatimonadales bacterium]|nr:carboxypeptidase-like regulatory domain-containing protein [Gemmatimonadales bacterium]